MKTAFYVLAISVLLMGGCRSSQSQKSSFRMGYDFTGVNKVAIVAVQGTLQSEAAKDQIAEFFAIELLDQGYAPVGRPQVRAALAEQGAAGPVDPNAPAAGFRDLTTNEAAVEVGRMLKVPAVLTINIPHFGDEITLTATMVDVEDGSILWLANGSGRGEGGLSGMFGLGAPEASSDEGLLGGIGGLDTTTGQPLSPREAKRAQRIVKSMCKSLPSKLAPEF
jgi:hypothetical protein